ncbi:hydantoinase B/oxoprolinase family protein [Halobaculum sp. EA56]|uniref:hydantoinase B/oxoprolinase family protein n=1 Tax=Halobaculum sp. EA56 TaxID=3421648 RepID=UPI003EB91663
MSDRTGSGGDGPGATGDADAGVDSVTLEVIRNGCEAVAEEMNATLVRTGYSPNIKERRDCSTALFDADGEMIAQAETMPVHLGAMPYSVAAAVEAFPAETLSPGDSVLLNDPFRGGAHLPDLTLVTPVHDAAGEEVVAFAANRAHHADIGGSTAGSVAADSTEIYQEGLRIPPVKFEEGTGAVGEDGTPEGEVREDVLSMVLANVRTPEERRGDLRAQVAANATGRRRFRDLAEEHGADLPPAVEEIKDYSERRMRAELAELPDGTYEFADALDDDGRGNEDLAVEAAVTVDGDEVTVDFTGTAEQTEGPVNAVLAVTASATYYAVRCVTDPDIPPNHGCYRPIEVVAPEGTIVNPEPPAAVVGGNLETSQRVTDVVLGALAEADPESVVAACQGTMNNVTLGGTDPRGDGDSPYAFYETQGGGFGGRAGGDGMDGVHVHMSNTLNTPAEVLETAYPLRIERYELRPDSGGPGEHRGGLGLRRDIRVRGHTARFSLLAERHESRPYGLAGGGEGAAGAAYIVDGSGDELETLPAKHTRDLPAGTVVSVRTPGGGGYGDPADRDAEAIERDLRLGKLTPEAARERYGHGAGADAGDD